MRMRPTAYSHIGKMPRSKRVNSSKPRGWIAPTKRLHASSTPLTVSSSLATGFEDLPPRDHTTIPGSMRVRFICIHGHFYQPPRENPWLEAVETQDSAHPYHDWNERITAECYEPNASSRILDAHDRIAK